MVRLIISLFAIFSLLRCAWPIYQNLPPQPVLDEFTLCYANNEILNNENLRFDGYYNEKQILKTFSLPDSSLTRIDTIYRNIILFTDGIVNMSLGDSNLARRKEGETNIQLYIDELGADHNLREVFLKSKEWGVYSLKNDTLRVQYFNHPAKLAPWYAIDVWYKIGSPDIIRRIDSRIMGISEEERIIRESNTTFSFEIIENMPLTFMPLETLPPSDCWLKDQKWFWCNEKDWIEYMEKKESGN